MLAVTNGSEHILATISVDVLVRVGRGLGLGLGFGMGIDIGLHGRVQVDADDNNLDTLKVLGVGKLGANKMAVRLVLQVNQSSLLVVAPCRRLHVSSRCRWCG